MHDNTGFGHPQAVSFWSTLAQEMSATSASAIPPKKPTKRIRISTACVNCRQKKIKCDGHAPCGHCEKFQADCVYPTITKHANQEYVETLENRLKSVESHLQGLLSRGWGKNVTGHDEHGDLEQDEGNVPAPYTPSSIPATPPSKSHHSSNESHSPPNTQRQTNCLLTRQLSEATISTPNPTGPGSKPANTAFNPDESMQVLGLLMGSLKVERDGTALYIPKALDQKERSYTDTRVYGSSPLSSLPSFTTMDWGSNEVPPPYTLPSNLLTPTAIGALMDIYFSSVHTFLPVIHKTSFLTLCQNGEYRVPPFLLMAICAVAARHATDFELQEIPELSNLQDHHALYDHARALLDTYIDVPRISTIQGLLLLAFYQTKEKRSGHFFRIRMYVSLATRMAMDMGLQHTILKSLSEVDPANTGDSPSSADSSYGRSLSAVNPIPQYSSVLNARQDGTREKEQQRSVIHQEKQLAWLGCFFLDGLTSSLMGQDYCVPTASLDVPKLIQEAGDMADTGQGATLIFWFHHLELVQIYRRICVFYRGISTQYALTQAAKNADMSAIETSMVAWLSTLPAHFVYIDNQDVGVAPPSYYTLYLHRFFYSHKLLLYRPFISNKAQRGSLNNCNSAISKCSHAATMLTQIGEIIFQNYSWPWPGCGLFAYHMLQAAEIHVFRMVTQSAVDSQALYYRTMDLIKGYVSLAKLPSLEKDIAIMEEMVSNFLLTPQDPASQAATPLLQHQQQHFVATPASDYSYASVMSPSSPAESVQRMAIHDVSHGGNMMSSNNKSSHVGGSRHQHGDDADMFSPLQTHAYPSFEAASRVFRQPQNNSSVESGFVASPMSNANGFSIGFNLPNASSASQGQSQSTASNVYGASDSMPFYNSAAPTGSTINMFGSNSQSDDLSYGQPSFLQPALAPTADLLGLEDMGSPAFATNQSSILPASQPLTVPSSVQSKKRSAAPPPKPPKRILSQSTGSSNSSGMSQSLKPPVPKKPTLLSESATHRWIAPRPESLVAPAVSIATSTSGSESYYNGKLSIGGSGHDISPPPYSSPNNGGYNGGSDGAAPSTPIPGGRPIKVLQPQTTLYGMGSLMNSLGVEQQTHPAPEMEDQAPSASPEHGYYAGPEHAFHYIQMNPHLLDQYPPNHRRQLL